MSKPIILLQSQVVLPNKFSQKLKNKPNVFSIPQLTLPPRQHIVSLFIDQSLDQYVFVPGVYESTPIAASYAL